MRDHIRSVFREKEKEREKGKKNIDSCIEVAEEILKCRSAVIAWKRRKFRVADKLRMTLLHHRVSLASAHRAIYIQQTVAQRTLVGANARRPMK